MERIREGAIGNSSARFARFAIRASGEMERRTHDSCVEKGNCGILGGDPLWIKSIEHVNLDGVPDPLSALAGTSASPPAAAS